MSGKISEFYIIAEDGSLSLVEIHIKFPNQPTRAFQPTSPIPLTMGPAFDYSDPIFTQEVSHE